MPDNVKEWLRIIRTADRKRYRNLPGTMMMFGDWLADHGDLRAERVIRIGEHLARARKELKETRYRGRYIYGWSERIFGLMGVWCPCHSSRPPGVIACGLACRRCEKCQGLGLLPREAEWCSKCNATGKLDIPGKTRGLPCPACSSMGWVMRYLDGDFAQPKPEKPDNSIAGQLRAAFKAAGVPETLDA